MNATDVHHGLEAVLDGRPVRVITSVTVSRATRRPMVGVRFLDVPAWEPLPGGGGYSRPAPGANKLAGVDELEPARPFAAIERQVQGALDELTKGC